ncbi:somatolactin-like [Ambystoma mexicanum]|uniref:somatolactin-like n=1 Tax=Ambystoma mexicanum TaxID=8296 RepID=UPI0037E74748
MTKLQKLSGSRAPRPDGLTNAMLKEHPEEWAWFLKLLFELITNTHTILDSWRQAIVVPIFKRGDREDPNNYRPIALLDVIIFLVVLLLLLPYVLREGVAYPTECKNEQGISIHCASISLEMVVDRVVQHAELIYRLSEQSCTIFEERLVPSARLQKYQTSCYNKELTMTIPNSKPEVHKLSDKWLLHSVLLMVQSWMEPFLYLQSALKHSDNIPAELLEKIKGLSGKLSSLEHGVMVLTKKVVDGAPLRADYDQAPSHVDFGTWPGDSAQRNYLLLDCFRKDAHKIETFLKLLKCRWTDTQSCNQSDS